MTNHHHQQQQNNNKHAMQHATPTKRQTRRQHTATCNKQQTSQNTTKAIAG